MLETCLLICQWVIRPKAQQRFGVRLLSNIGAAEAVDF